MFDYYFEYVNSIECEKCRTHRTCDNGMSNKLDRYTIDHQTGEKLFFQKRGESK